jgi:hypothetical protein
MAYLATKIATCCYCGTRAALVLGKKRQELSCASCGAPLHEMKRLPSEHPGKHELVRPSAVRPTTPKRKKDDRMPERGKYRKKRKSLFQNLVEEAFDAIEDIFD